MPKNQKTSFSDSKDLSAWPGMMKPDFGMANSMMAPFLSANVAMLHWNARNFERMAQSYQQWLTFIGQRLEEDASFTEKMQKAKDNNEIAEACSKFVEKATKDYQAEISELTKISSQFSNEAADALQDLSVAPGSGAVTGD